jgi:GNAT superfamily N-acetyltransferase
VAAEQTRQPGQDEQPGAGIVVRLVLWDDPVGSSLRTAQKAEMIALYGRDVEPGTKPTAADIDVFVIAYDTASSTALGCGAMRLLPDPTDHPGETAAELKRMYVLPEQRGRGIGKRILAEIESHARRRGIHRMRLETGTLQPEAVGLYERAGYRQIPNFGPYAGSETSLCFERVLDPT